MNNYDLKALKAEKIKRNCQKDLYTFCKVVSPNVFNTNDRKRIFKDLADYITKFVEKYDLEEDIDVDNLGEEELEELINHIKINLATFPRAAKSYFIAHFCSWILGKKPKIRIMIVGRSDDLAAKFIKTIINIMNRNIYKFIFPRLEITNESANLIGVRNIGDDIKKPESIYAAGINGQLTGFGANIMILDDIYKNHEEAFSEIINKKVRSNYSSAISSRLEGLNRIEVHIGTRWSKNELFAELELKNFYDYQVKTPAYDEENERSLFPTIHSTQKLKFEKKMNEIVFQSAYQQNAIDQHFKLFKKSDFMMVSKFIAGPSNRLMIIDPARGGGDYLAAGIWANQIDGRDVLEEALITNEDIGKTQTYCYGLGLHYKPRIIFIETNNDRALFVYLRDLFTKKHSNLGILVKEFTTTKKKHDKIHNNTSRIKTRTLLNEALVESKQYSKFMENVFEFYYETKGHDDAPDLLAIKEELTREHREFLRYLMKYRYKDSYSIWSDKNAT